MTRKPSPARCAATVQTRRPRINQSLASIHSALEALRPALDSATPATVADATDSAHRLAALLLTHHLAAQSAELVAAAHAVASAEPHVIGLRVDELMPLVRAGSELSRPAVATVLVIEDDTVLAKLLEVHLTTPERRVLVATSVKQATRILAQENVSLILLDLILPDGDGRNLLFQLRADARTAGIPVVVVSCRVGPQPKTECFALGADAYYEKPLDVASLSVAIGARLGRAVVCTRETRRDSVTGLPNRAAFYEGFQQLQDPANRVGAPLALAILDLDHFRWVDDTLGHKAADGVMRRIGVRLAMSLRRAGLFARWEGAEFIAVFPGLSGPEAARLLELALRTIRGLDLRPTEGPPFQVSFSAGVIDVPISASVEEALSLADRVRYLAKTGGGGQVLAGDEHTLPPAQRILFAEDDEAIHRVVARHLMREGFDVVHYPDGAQALAAAAESGAALVLSDIEMPNLDGLGLLTGIRQIPSMRHVPVMMLTAVGDENHIVRAFDLGADDYVVKPFSMREVTARIRRLLKRPTLIGVPVKVAD